MADADADADDGNSDNKAISVQLSWGLTELGKNDLRVMKRILYDMGPLTLVRWLLHRAFKFESPFRPGSELKRVPASKIEKISVS